MSEGISEEYLESILNFVRSPEHDKMAARELLREFAVSCRHGGMIDVTKASLFPKSDGPDAFRRATGK